MSNVELRRQIKKAVDKLPADRLTSLADYVDYLTRPALLKRVEAAEKAIAAGHGQDWREVRSDV